MTPSDSELLKEATQYLKDWEGVRTGPGGGPDKLKLEMARFVCSRLSAPPGEWQWVPKEPTAEGTFDCPVCGWPEVHAHNDYELVERPYIDGARTAFEKEAREFMLRSYFNGLRTGFNWGNKAERARTLASGAIHQSDWAARQWPQGLYVHTFVNVMWELWCKAWLSARQSFAAPSHHSGSVVDAMKYVCETALAFRDATGASRISAGNELDDALREYEEALRHSSSTGAEDG